MSRFGLRIENAWNPCASMPRDHRWLTSGCRTHERLQETSGGRLVYRMKTPWRSGQTHVVMERIELIEKLAALVPRPRYHIVHYYGVFCPRREMEKGDRSRSPSAGTMFT